MLSIISNLRGLSPLFLWLITPPELLTTFNRNFWELREKRYTFASKHLITISVKGI